MTTSHFKPDDLHIKWFRIEQALFLRSARIKADLSINEVIRRTGIDISLFEKGESSPPMKETLKLIHLYGINELDFSIWQRKVGDKLRELTSQSP